MASGTPVKLGGLAPGAPPNNTALILKAALGLPIQLVSGYKGTAESGWPRTAGRCRAPAGPGSRCGPRGGTRSRRATRSRSCK